MLSYKELRINFEYHLISPPPHDHLLIDDQGKNLVIVFIFICLLYCHNLSCNSHFSQILLLVFSMCLTLTKVLLKISICVQTSVFFKPQISFGGVMEIKPNVETQMTAIIERQR